MRTSATTTSCLICTLFIGYLTLAVPSPGSAQPEMPVPCQEGLFRDYSATPALCRPLDQSYGFAGFTVPNNQETVQPTSGNPSVCLREDVREALVRIGDIGGGTVFVPGCTVQVNIEINIPNNTVLQGAGVGQTVFVAASGFNGALLRANRKQNVIVRNLTMDGAGRSFSPFDILYSDNVLGEGLEIRRSAVNGMNFQRSQRITLRYSAVNDHTNLNGVATKDCYPSARGDVNKSMCEASNLAEAKNKFCQLQCQGEPQSCFNACMAASCPPEAGPNCLGYGSLYTTNYSIYSNFMSGMDVDHCLDLHARNGEVAGNICRDSWRGIKTPDAQNVWIHHNIFTDLDLWGVHAYSPVGGLPATDIYVYQNDFIGLGEAVTRSEGVQGFYLIDNHYENNMLCPPHVANLGLCANSFVPTNVNFIRNTDDVAFDGSTFQSNTLICATVQGNPTEEQLILDAEDNDSVNGACNCFDEDPDGYALASLCNQFSPTLPVELTSFEAFIDGDAVRLIWSTATETNNAGFEVEIRNFQSAIPNAEWQSVGWVEGHGTTTEARTYAYQLTNLEPGLHRFRLKQVDYDGAFDYSPEVEITLDLPGTHWLGLPYPNPFNPRSTLMLSVVSEQPVRVEAFDAMGRLVQTLHDGPVQPRTPYRFTFDGTHLPNGLYVIRAVGETFTEAHGVTLVK